MKTAEELLAIRFGDRPNITSLFIRVADRCNHSCEHCFEVQGHRGELDTQSVLRIIDRAADDGVLFLTMSGGEITLRSDLLELVQHARGRHLAVTLYSNAYLMTEQLASRLAELGVWQVQVSLYAVDPEIHDAVTRVPGSHEKSVRGIEMLRAAGVQVAISFPLMARNVHQRREMLVLAERLGCYLRASEQLSGGEDGSSRSELRAEPATLVELQPGAQLDFSPEATSRARAGRTCGVGRGNLAIDPNGDVRPCTMLAVPLGNAVNESLAEISQSAAARFIKSIDVQALHGCRDCDLIAGCGRCHAIARREAGDALGPYLSSCELAVARYRSTQAGVVEVVPAKDEPGRPSSLGPFVVESPIRLRQIPDRRTASDQELAQKFDWIRPAAGYEAGQLRAAGEALVPLRIRPRQQRTD
jgi:radical SAM protein with 4Fe4S-binding SPASM domain